MLARRSFRRKGWHPRVRRLARVRSLYWTLVRGHETEICGRCGGPVRLVFHAPDALWLRYCGTNQPPHGVLCPACFCGLVVDDGGRTPFWSCTEGEFPQCDGSPCAHEEAMVEIGDQRTRLWNALLNVSGSREVAIAAINAAPKEHLYEPTA